MVRSIFIYFLILIQVLSVAKAGVVSHYCGGKVIETRFFLGCGNASCGMEQDDTSKSVDAFQKPCCKNVCGKLEMPSTFEVAHRVLIAIADYILPIPCCHNLLDYAAITSMAAFRIYHAPTLHPPGDNLSRLQVFRI